MGTQALPGDFSLVYHLRMVSPRMVGCLTLICAASLSTTALATTWDEPWHDQVVREASSLVKAEVVKLEGDGVRARARLVNNVVGAALSGDFLIEGYYLLRIGSYSQGHEPRLELGEHATYYFFLKPGRQPGTFSIATPTTGYANVKTGEVKATYRHSYHQALVPEPIYVESQTVIFHALHDEPFDRAVSARLSDTWLTQPPKAPVGPEDSKVFFAQHVALETLFHTKAAGVDPDKTISRLAPFLAYDADHAQISAARALSVIGTPGAQQALMAFVEGKHSGFAKVMALWGLKRQNARQLTARLKAYQEVADTDRLGFGGNIMDPRVGTRFPTSVKAVVQELVTEWDTAPSGATAPSTGTIASSSGPTASGAPVTPMAAGTSTEAGKVAPGPHGCGGCEAGARSGRSAAWAITAFFASLWLRRRRRSNRPLPVPAMPGGV